MVDPITLEVIRCRLEATAEDGSRTVIRTAISPVVAEAGDCSCTIYDAEGDLVVGGGAVQIHFHVGGNGIRAIRELHGDTLAPGDIFLVNDPYNGGGLHAQDVFIHVPVFHGDELVAWVGASAHMMDMGGMVPGSFATAATEVYQEAFRVPPVRLARAGIEQKDVWAILRNNIRMASTIEMDMRSLISGVTVVKNQILKLVDDYGAEVFTAATRDLSNLTEAEVRRRINELEPGLYRAATWSEWTDEFYHIPCALTVEADRLIFDFHGASPQTNHFFNSKPYVIKSLIGIQLAAYVAKGLPLNEGLFRAFDVRCEPGSILDAQPPAPIGGPHLDVGQAALETAIRTLNLAVAASPDARARANMAGPSASSGIALHTLAGKGFNGEPIGWVMLDGGLVGASAGHDRDALHTTYQVIGSGILEIVDVEVLESWYPIRFEERKLRPGAIGAGAHCAGRPMSLSYTVAGTPELTLSIMGNRERMPIAGMAGGLPGAVTRLQLQHADASEPEPLACHQDGVALREGDTIIVNVANGGGWGDPLERSPQLVEDDVRRGLLTVEEARSVFGIVPGDNAATGELRLKLRRERLARAEAAPHPLSWNAELRGLAEGLAAPLTTLVEQRGAVAVAMRSGAPLAVAPAPWTDGCPRIHNFVPSSSDVDAVAYLDPESGDLLAVDVTPVGEPCSFEVAPHRWTNAGGGASVRAAAE
jgi:N-methylhydantoinase B